MQCKKRWQKHKGENSLFQMRTLSTYSNQWGGKIEKDNWMINCFIKITVREIAASLHKKSSIFLRDWFRTFQCKHFPFALFHIFFFYETCLNFTDLKIKLYLCLTRDSLVIFWLLPKADISKSTRKIKKPKHKARLKKKASNRKFLLNNGVVTNIKSSQRERQPCATINI